MYAKGVRRWILKIFDAFLEGEEEQCRAFRLDPTVRLLNRCRHRPTMFLGVGMGESENAGPN